MHSKIKLGTKVHIPFNDIITVFVFIYFLEDTYLSIFPGLKSRSLMVIRNEIHLLIYSFT